MKINLKIYSYFKKSDFITNSFWGLASRLIQTVFLSIFFVIISKQYSTADFASFLIASGVYQFMAGISSMGLSNWFIREYEHTIGNKEEFLNKFIKIQIGLGFTFYLLNILFVFILYPQSHIKFLGLILGSNIIFDNIIYGLTALNIAKGEQKKTAILMGIDALLRFSTVCILFIYSFSILTLSFFLVLIRFVTVNLFIRIINSSLNIKGVLKHNISINDLKKQIFQNWRFVIIMSLTVILWRSATIIISKTLALSDVANYEIAYKFFSIFIILPTIASATIFPRFVKLYSTGNLNKIQKFYNVTFLGFTFISLIAYAFIQSFADVIVPLVFGNRFTLASTSLKEMC